LPFSKMGSYFSKNKDGTETKFSTSINIETKPVCCNFIKDDSSDDSPVMVVSHKIAENLKAECQDSSNSSAEPNPSEELLSN